MTRLNRAESQARTRRQLVETARRLFLHAGYFATSLEAVAEEAGYSKGAVYSNFGSKTELCLAVLDRIHEEQAAAIASELEGVTTPDEGIAALERWADENIGNLAWTALEVEFATVGRHDEGVRAALTARRKQIRDMVAAVIAAQAERFEVALPMTPEHAADLALSAGIGVGVQRAVDPSVSVVPLTGMVRLLMNGVKDA